MNISEKDMFIAILSKDSYNRGYLLGIALTGNTIGSATISDDRFLPEGSDAAGFYAAAYTTQYGTVISYRGTDFNGIPSPLDVTHGWTIGAGFYSADQFALSTEFLAQVAQTREGLAGNDDVREYDMQVAA